MVNCGVVVAEKDSRCFRCGVFGHWTRNCKEKCKVEYCFRCGETGHFARQCVGKAEVHRSKGSNVMYDDRIDNEEKGKN